MDASDIKDAIVPLIKPLLIATLAVAAGLYFFNIEVPEDEPMKSLGFAATGFLFFAIAAAFLLVPIFRLGSTILESLFWPTDTYTPPALYKLAEFYTKEGRFGDALAEYEKIDKNHPRQLPTYLGILEVQITWMGDAAGAERTLQRGLHELKKDDQKMMLQQHYETLWQEVYNPQPPAAESDQDQQPPEEPPIQWQPR